MGCAAGDKFVDIIPVMVALVATIHVFQRSRGGCSGQARA